MTDTKLKRLPSSLTTWGKWRSKHPSTEVLTPVTGHVRDYSKDPYEDYYKSRSGLFGFLKGGPGAEDKELVVGIETGGESRAYKLNDLRKVELLSDQLGTRKIALNYDHATDQLSVTDQTNQAVPHIVLYWFVWKGLYPESEVFKIKQK